MAALLGGAVADAAQHGAQGQLDARSFEIARIHIGDAFLFIDLPRHRFGSRERFQAQEAGVGGVGRQQRCGKAGGAVGLQTQQMNHESVARLGAFDVERACFRIGSLAALHAGGVDAARVDRVGDHVVARLDTKRGFMRAGEGVVELLWAQTDGFRRNR